MYKVPKNTRKFLHVLCVIDCKFALFCVMGVDFSGSNIFVILYFL